MLIRGCTKNNLRRESANRCVVNATGENINRNKLARLGPGFFRFRPPDCRERTRWRRLDHRWNSWHLARRGIPDCGMPVLEVLRSNSGRISGRGSSRDEIASEMRQAAEAM